MLLLRDKICGIHRLPQYRRPFSSPQYVFSRLLYMWLPLVTEYCRIVVSPQIGGIGGHGRLYQHLQQAMQGWLSALTTCNQSISPVIIKYSIQRGDFKLQDQMQMVIISSISQVINCENEICIGFWEFRNLFILCTAYSGMITQLTMSLIK